MRWYVLASDGSVYGPVDLPTLAQWAAEGRLTSSTPLREETTGTQLTAGELDGIRHLLVPGQTLPPAHTCMHCGAAMSPVSAYCGACGAGTRAEPRRRITASGGLDAGLGILTVIGVCLLTLFLVAHKVTLGGLVAMLPIVGPIVLIVGLSRTYTSYVKGIATGCALVGCVVPAVLATLVALGIHQLSSGVGGDWSKLLRCGF